MQNTHKTPLPSPQRHRKQGKILLLPKTTISKLVENLLYNMLST